MIKTIYDRLIDIHNLAGYTPFVPQYTKYDTNIIFTSIKIVDLYVALCNARSNIHFLDNQDFGDFARDKVSTKYVKSLLIQNSLIYYNISIDYSWQLLWLYIDDSLIGKLPTKELYESRIKECTYEGLLLDLTLKRDIKLREIVKDFFAKNAQIVNKFRPKYNYLKHRGGFYYEGLGENTSFFPITFQEKEEVYRIPMVSRDEINVEELKEVLLEFDTIFVGFVSYLISLIMPNDFCSPNVSLGELMQYPLKYVEEIKSYKFK